MPGIASELAQILKLDGLPFVEALLDWEAKRFDDPSLWSSIFAELNTEFGSFFPDDPVYPSYFSGDITQPTGKTILVGINPGYDEEDTGREQHHFRTYGLYQGSCSVYSDYYAANKISFFRYYSSLGKFLAEYLNVPSQTIDWLWCHKNLITLEMIPYHSRNINGLSFNDPERFANVRMASFFKLVKHLNPSGPILINGFPTFEKTFNTIFHKSGIDFKFQRYRTPEGNIVRQGNIGPFKFIGFGQVGSRSVRTRGGPALLGRGIRDLCKD